MKKVFYNLHLIDGTRRDILKDAYITVNGTTIEEIGQHYNIDANRNIQKINLNNHYVMPGMIDTHVHTLFQPVPHLVHYIENVGEVEMIINAAKNLEAMLKSGVTYIRDLGGVNNYDLQMRELLAAHKMLGPEMQVAGKAITMTGGHLHMIGTVVDGCDEVRKAVRQHILDGVDVIKLMATGGATSSKNVHAFQLNIDEMKTAVEEAHKAGLKVAAHCHGNQGIKNAILAGVDSIEHGTMLDDEAVDMIIKSGVYINFTHSAAMNIINNGVENGIPKLVVDQTQDLIDEQFKFTRKLYEQGANISMGSDAGTPFNVHGKNYMELIYMANHSPDNLSVIVAATKTSAELMGIDDKYGTLEPNKVCDFIVLKNNPLDDICALHHIEKVYKQATLV